VDGDNELGYRVQRDPSAAKLAPNVGPEASKGPMGGALRARIETYDQVIKKALDLENISKILQKDHNFEQ